MSGALYAQCSGVVPVLTVPHAVAQQLLALTHAHALWVLAHPGTGAFVLQAHLMRDEAAASAQPRWWRALDRLRCGRLRRWRRGGRRGGYGGRGDRFGHRCALWRSALGCGASGLCLRLRCGGRRFSGSVGNRRRSRGRSRSHLGNGRDGFQLRQDQHLITCQGHGVGAGLCHGVTVFWLRCAGGGIHRPSQHKQHEHARHGVTVPFGGGSCDPARQECPGVVGVRWV